MSLERAFLSYLLPLLDSAHGVWLKLQFVRAAQFPVQYAYDDHHHQHRHHHSYYNPCVSILCLSWQRRLLLHSWTHDTQKYKHSYNIGINYGTYNIRLYGDFLVNLFVCYGKTGWKKI